MKPNQRSKATGRIAAGLGIALLSAGCQTQLSGQGTIDIALEDLRFVPNYIYVKVGVPITVRITNDGSERHDLNFEALHMPGLEGVEAILDPGETRTLTLTFDQPGTHTFICSLPGHATAGMTGAAFVSS